MDLISGGIDWINQRLFDDGLASVDIVYIRGEVHYDLTAVIGKGRTSVRDETRGHIQVEYSDADFIINVSSFMAAGLDRPRHGDAIRRVEGANTFEYEVGPMGGDGPWRYSDEYQRNYRIHTKLVQIR